MVIMNEEENLPYDPEEVMIIDDTSLYARAKDARGKKKPKPKPESKEETEKIEINIGEL